MDICQHACRRLATTIDGRNMPSTAVDRDRTCANAGERSQKSDTKDVLRPSTACSMLDFETVPALAHGRSRSTAIESTFTTINGRYAPSIAHFGRNVPQTAAVGTQRHRATHPM